MGLYIQAQAVQIRLIGKVRFTDDLEDENKMPFALLNRLINEAEGQVEFDLSPRYATPFQTDAGAPFDNLPLRPTQERIRTLCELKAVMRVLQTDFGRGTAVSGDEYYKSLEAQYKEMMAQIIQRDRDVSNKWMYPPLPGLMLNWFNTAADDGFAGMVINTSTHGRETSYPVDRINSPSKTFWNIGPEDLK